MFVVQIRWDTNPSTKKYEPDIFCGQYLYNGATEIGYRETRTRAYQLRDHYLTNRKNTLKAIGIFQAMNMFWNFSLPCWVPKHISYTCICKNGQRDPYCQCVHVMETFSCYLNSPK